LHVPYRYSSVPPMHNPSHLSCKNHIHVSSKSVSSHISSVRKQLMPKHDVCPGRFCRMSPALATQCGLHLPHYWQYAACFSTDNSNRTNKCDNSSINFY